MLNVFYQIPGVTRILERFPPTPTWKYERQPNPPSFGWARRVSDAALERIVTSRLPACQAAVEKYPAANPGQVDLMILSCKRWPALQRNIQSLQNYFSNTDLYPKLRKILVDNGSGPDLVEPARATGFFDHIIAFEKNLGMVGALKKAYAQSQAEFILLLEDDFVVESDRPFLEPCLRIFKEFPEIGTIRLKNQNNWWKPHRIISNLRKTSSEDSFYTWLPSSDGSLNVWAAGSVLFRRASYQATGELPDVESNLTRDQKLHQGFIYECVYGEKYNRTWLAAKSPDLCPFVQPNDNEASTGWGE